MRPQKLLPEWLTQNPYLRERLDGLWRVRNRLLLTVGYAVAACGHLVWLERESRWTRELLNGSRWPLILQEALLRQSAIFAIAAFALLPLLTSMAVFREISNRRLMYVQLTPLSKRDIMIGIAGRELLPALIILSLMAVLALATVAAGGVTPGFALVTLGNLTLVVILAVLAGAAIALFFERSLAVAILSSVAICGSAAAYHASVEYKSRTFFDTLREDRMGYYDRESRGEFGLLMLSVPDFEARLDKDFVSKKQTRDRIPTAQKLRFNQFRNARRWYPFWLTTSRAVWVDTSYGEVSKLQNGYADQSSFAMAFAGWHSAFDRPGPGKPFDYRRTSSMGSADASLDMDGLDSIHSRYVHERVLSRMLDRPPSDWPTGVNKVPVAQLERDLRTFAISELARNAVRFVGRNDRWNRSLQAEADVLFQKLGSSVGSGVITLLANSFQLPLYRRQIKEFLRSYLDSYSRGYRSESVYSEARAVAVLLRMLDGPPQHWPADLRPAGEESVKSDLVSKGIELMIERGMAQVSWYLQNEEVRNAADIVESGALIKRRHPSGEMAYLLNLYQVPKYREPIDQYLKKTRDMADRIVASVRSKYTEFLGQYTERPLAVGFLADSSEWQDDGPEPGGDDFLWLSLALAAKLATIALLARFISRNLFAPRPLHLDSLTFSVFLCMLTAMLVTSPESWGVIIVGALLIILFHNKPATSVAWTQPTWLGTGYGVLLGLAAWMVARLPDPVSEIDRQLGKLVTAPSACILVVFCLIGFEMAKQVWAVRLSKPAAAAAGVGLVLAGFTLAITWHGDLHPTDFKWVAAVESVFLSVILVRMFLLRRRARAAA